MNAELDRKLRHLRLSGFVQALPVRNQEAINNHLAYVEFLELLVEDELARRRQLLFQRRIKQAQLPQLFSTRITTAPLVASSRRTLSEL